MKINHLAVWIVAFVLQILGFIWYSNWGFGPVWMQGLNKDSSALMTSDPTPYLISLTSSVIICYGVSWLIDMLEIKSLPKALSTAIFISFFFLLPVLLTHYSFIGVNYIVTIIDWGMSAILLSVSFVALSIFSKKSKQNIKTTEEKEIEPLSNNLA